MALSSKEIDVSFAVVNVINHLEPSRLVEVPRYKPEGRGFDSRWCHLNFSLT